MSTMNSDKEVVKLKAFAEKSVIPTPHQFERVGVNIDLKAVVLTTYVKELFSQWDTAASFLGKNLGFSFDELTKYVSNLIKLRIRYVNGKRVDIRPTDAIAVPSFLSLVLSNIGLARDTTMGIEIFPVIDEDELTTVDYDELHVMSRKIQALQNIGVEYAQGYARSRDGSYEFMTMTLIDDKIRTWTRDSHPVYALMASVVGLRGIETVLSPRIDYGSVTHMESLVRHLASVKG